MAARLPRSRSKLVELEREGLQLRPDSVTAKAALTSFSYTAPALLLTLPGEETLIFYCLASEESI